LASATGSIVNLLRRIPEQRGIRSKRSCTAPREQIDRWRRPTCGRRCRRCGRRYSVSAAERSPLCPVPRGRPRQVGTRSRRCRLPALSIRRRLARGAGVRRARPRFRLFSVDIVSSRRGRRSRPWLSLRGRLWIAVSSGYSGSRDVYEREAFCDRYLLARFDALVFRGARRVHPGHLRDAQTLGT
jgi:hypothetical protein